MLFYKGFCRQYFLDFYGVNCHIGYIIPQGGNFYPLYKNLSFMTYKKIIKSLVFLGVLGALVSCSYFRDVPTTFSKIPVVSFDDEEKAYLDPDDAPIKLNDFVSYEIKDTFRHYGVNWLGLNVADMYTHVKRLSDDSYDFKVFIRSKNVAKMISRFKSDTSAIVNYHIGINGAKYTPYEYETLFNLRKKRRKIMMFFSDDGKRLLRESNVPPERRWKREEVLPELKIEVYDPLSVVFEARRKIIDGIKTGNHLFAMPLYDGRRRTILHFRIYGQTDEGLIHVSFSEEPVSGYTNNEMKNFTDGTRIFHMYLSPNDFLPVKTYAKSPAGNAKIYLKRECRDEFECMP